MSFDDFREADLPALLEMNQANTPALGDLDMDRLVRLADQAFSVRVIRAPDGLAGFMITVIEGSDYASPNYRWFADRYDRFLYIDRLTVAADRRGQGLGRRLYDDATALRPGVPLCCEVNVKPPNPESLAFHARLGFSEVGQQDTEGGKKRVSLLLREE